MDTIEELIVDAYGCTANLSDARRLEAIARESVEKEGATVAERVSYSFQPHGLTLCLVLKESHLIISTWPEYQLAIANIFLCNDQMSTVAVWERIAKFLNPSQEKRHTVVHQVGQKTKAA